LAGLCNWFDPCWCGAMRIAAGTLVAAGLAVFGVQGLLAQAGGIARSTTIASS